MFRTSATRVAARGILATIAATTCLVVALPSTAHAELNAPISGSTYSSSTVWYTSTNWRTITWDAYGNVYINIDSYPKLSTGGSAQLKWRLNFGETDSNTTYLGKINSWDYIGSWAEGTQFRNKYARYTTCNNCNHNFSGNMDY